MDEGVKALQAIADALNRQAAASEYGNKLMDEQAEYMRTQMRVSEALEQRLMLDMAPEDTFDA